MENSKTTDTAHTKNIWEYRVKSLTILILFVSIQTQAAVWTAVRAWTPADEINYSEFISKSVDPLFFKNMGQPFSELKLDCADAAYALRIYYSKMNGLPFHISDRNVSNHDRRFDYISDENKKLAAFIFDVVDNNGTENLSADDSFPIGIQTIRGGDVFMYKIETAPGTFSRHTYLIKNVNTNGTFDVLYSTQARRDAGQPMNRIAQYSFTNAKWIPNHTAPGDKNSWGFRRMKMPQQKGIRADQIPDANFEQYNLAAQWGDQFFDYVKNQRTTIKETPNEIMNRMYEFLCHELNDRVEIVALAQIVRGKTNNACMDPATFDTYSTPSRDGGILGSYNKLYSQSNLLKQSGEWKNVNPNLQTIIDAIFNPNRTAQATQLMQTSCTFQKQQGLNTNVGLFYEALQRGQVSSHPNDSLFNRWGVVTSTTAPLTECPRY